MSKNTYIFSYWYKIQVKLLKYAIHIRDGGSVSVNIGIFLGVSVFFNRYQYLENHSRNSIIGAGAYYKFPFMVVWSFDFSFYYVFF